MSATMSPAVRTVLQLLQARQMFIGDELRVSALRVAWSESGHEPEEFGHAISELTTLGFVRSVHGTRGPAIQLTQTGFRASTAQPVQTPTAASPPVAKTKTPAPTTSVTRPATPSAPEATVTPERRRRINPLVNPASLITNPLSAFKNKPVEPAAPKPRAPAQQPVAASPAVPAAPTRESTNEQLAHAQVFRTRTGNLNDNVLRHCLLGLLHHYKLRPDGRLSYATIMQHWDEMGLTRSDLLYSLDLLISDGSIRTTMQPTETVILTKRGYEITSGGSNNLDDGMDRWQAKKRLRLTKRLGELPAA